MEPLHTSHANLSRRSLLKIGGGFGAVGLAAALAGDQSLSAATSAASANPLAPKLGHYPAKIKRIIFLFMNGGPSHVDSFDPKPELTRHHGEKLPESFVGKNTRR